MTTTLGWSKVRATRALISVPLVVLLASCAAVPSVMTLEEVQARLASNPPCSTDAECQRLLESASTLDQECGRIPATSRQHGDEDCMREAVLIHHARAATRLLHAPREIPMPPQAAQVPPAVATAALSSGDPAPALLPASAPPSPSASLSIGEIAIQWKQCCGDPKGRDCTIHAYQQVDNTLWNSFDLDGCCSAATTDEFNAKCSAIVKYSNGTSIDNRKDGFINHTNDHNCDTFSFITRVDKDGRLDQQGLRNIAAAREVVAVAICRLAIEGSQSCERLQGLIDRKILSPETQSQLGTIFGAAKPHLDDALWSEARRDACAAPSHSDDCETVENYLNKFPNGAHATEAVALLNSSKKARIKLKAQEDASTRERIRIWQTEKKPRCYDPCYAQCASYPGNSAEDCRRNCLDKCG